MTLTELLEVSEFEGNVDNFTREWELSNRDLARGIRETTTVQEFTVEEQRMHIHNRQTKNTKISCCFIELGGCIVGYKAQEIAVMSQGTGFHNTFAKEDRQLMRRTIV